MTDRRETLVRPVFRVAPIKKNESFAVAQFAGAHRAKVVSAGLRGFIEEGHRLQGGQACCGGISRRTRNGYLGRENNGQVQNPYVQLWIAASLAQCFFIPLKIASAISISVTWNKKSTHLGRLAWLRIYCCRGYVALRITSSSCGYVLANQLLESRPGPSSGLLVHVLRTFNSTSCSRRSSVSGSVSSASRLPSSQS